MAEVEDRLVPKMSHGDGPMGCWKWRGATMSNGYGSFRLNNAATSAHRAVYAVFVGEIPDKYVIDHLCRNRACVNPLHLEAVSQRENIMRGVGVKNSAAKRRAATHCKRGHLLSGPNVRINHLGHRMCKACQAAAATIWHSNNQDHINDLQRSRRLAARDLRGL